MPRCWDDSQKGNDRGGGLNWLDEKHLAITVHYPRANTETKDVASANYDGARQLEEIVKEQDPEVDVKIGPGYGGRGIWLWPVDKHTSVSDPEHIDQNFVRWLKAELGWTFLVPPSNLSFLAVSGVVLKPGKIIKPTGTPKGTKWLESQGIEVVEVDVSSLVIPRNSGTIQCLTRELIRDPEPKG